MDKTRLFTIEWDNTKASTRLAKGFREKKHTAEGVHFARGTIALDNGAHFDTKADMDDHFEKHGKMAMKYQDDQDEPSTDKRKWIFG